jgi:hypothetical protein
MIDNGRVFQGSNWTFRDSAACGVYWHRAVYPTAISMRDVEPWIEIVMRIQEDVLHHVVSGIPREWLAGDERELPRLIAGLVARRPRLPSLVKAAISWIQERDGICRVRVESQAEIPTEEVA